MSASSISTKNRGTTNNTRHFIGDRREEKSSLSLTMKTATLATLSYFCLFLQVLYHDATADVYFHIPRGSNNRLKAEKVNRQKANRVFDSQPYYMSGPDNAPTILPLEWTNQHGCGHPDLNCNIVLQYKCQPTSVEEKHRIMRNGDEEKIPDYKFKNYKSFSEKEAAMKSQTDTDKVLNEPWEWYDKCVRRERNKGLFTADQKLKRTRSKFTRQNPKGKRYGYECPEERDYYPYFHPTDWIDIAVLANDKSTECPYYKQQSFNTQPKGECMELYNKRASWDEEDNPWRHASKYNNKEACEAKSGKWVNFYNYLEKINKTKAECDADDSFMWAIPYRSEDLDRLHGAEPEDWKECLVKLPKPDCIQAPESRPNHLGNGEGVVPLGYDWVLPHFPSGQEQRCVLRIRYNISTNDYDPNNTFSDANNNDEVISNDPEVEIGKDDNNKVRLQLAINTAQFGRTFQDRSHTFRIIPRENHFKDKHIHILSVKGKRGNIVQAYPAVEYDFHPKDLELKANHLVHMLWGGSNRNPKGNAGEGRKQTDRSNIVAMGSPDWSYPKTNTADTMFDSAEVIHAPDPDHYAKTVSGADIAIFMATAGHFKTAAEVPSPFAVNGCSAQEAEQLDCYPASTSGLLLKIPPGTYYYMCTRNNNFTNRNQKGSLTVEEAK